MKKAVFLVLIILFAWTASAHPRNSKRKYRNYCCECPYDPKTQFVVRVKSKLTGIRKCKEMCGFDYDDPKAVAPKFTWGECPQDQEQEDGP